MTLRISDPRIVQAQRHGIIVGLPREDAYNIAIMADLLSAMVEWRDVLFMFPLELDHYEGQTWRIRVDDRWFMIFEWVDELGAINIRLLE